MDFLSSCVDYGLPEVPYSRFFGEKTLALFAAQFLHVRISLLFAFDFFFFAQ